MKLIFLSFFTCVYTNLTQHSEYFTVGNCYLNLIPTNNLCGRICRNL